MSSNDIDKNQFDDLKKTIAKISSDKIDLSNKLDEKNSEIAEYLNIAGMSVIDCTDDLRVLQDYGATAVVFKEVIKSFDRGVNLVRMVHKITRNFKEKFDDPNIDPDEQPDLEKSVMNFILGSREEKEFKIVGESENGEIFLLIWKMKRRDKQFRNYFRVIPSNIIIESAQQHHITQLKHKESETRELMNMVSDGICMLDSHSKVTFINDAGKNIFISNSAEILRKANVEGKFFRELLIAEETEKLNKILQFNTSAISNKKVVQYSKMANGKDVDFTVHPQFDKLGNNLGLIITAKIVNRNDNQFAGNPNFDQKKIVATIKQLLEEKNIAIERIKELEINHKWLQKKLAEMNENTKIFHKTLRSLYSYLESVPLPISILQLPTEKYEFVNKAFENYFNLQKADILNKTDKDIFEEKINIVLKDKVNEIIKTNIQNELSTEKFNIMQSIILNDNLNPIHLVRVMIIKEKLVL